MFVFKPSGTVVTVHLAGDKVNSIGHLFKHAHIFSVVQRTNRKRKEVERLTNILCRNIHISFCFNFSGHFLSFTSFILSGELMQLSSISVPFDKPFELS